MVPAGGGLVPPAPADQRSPNARRARVRSPAAQAAAAGEPGGLGDRQLDQAGPTQARLIGVGRDVCVVERYAQVSFVHASGRVAAAVAGVPAGAAGSGRTAYCGWRPGGAGRGRPRRCVGTRHPSSSPETVPAEHLLEVGDTLQDHSRLASSRSSVNGQVMVALAQLS